MDGIIKNCRFQFYKQLQELFEHINKQVVFPKSEFQDLILHFELIELEKKHKLVEAGDRILHQYFVIEGCLRTFLIDTFGKEHTIQFAIENWWVSDYISYYKEVPSIFEVECIENCRLLKISKSRLLSLFPKSSGLETYFRKQLENAFVAFQTRILSNLNMSAEERYIMFTKTYPNIEQRVKNYQIASYLGITAESLSRIRKQRS